MTRHKNIFRWLFILDPEHPEKLSQHRKYFFEQSLKFKTFENKKNLQKITRSSRLMPVKMKLTLIRQQFVSVINFINADQDYC